jgi:hypothetical protein
MLVDNGIPQTSRRGQAVICPFDSFAPRRWGRDETLLAIAETEQEIFAKQVSVGSV